MRSRLGRSRALERPLWQATAPIGRSSGPARSYERSTKARGRGGRLLQVGDRALRGGHDGACVFGQDAAGVGGLGSFPLRKALLDFLLGDAKRERPLLCIDGDRIAVFDDRKGTAQRGLGSDVA